MKKTLLFIVAASMLYWSAGKAQLSTTWERCSRTGALASKPAWFGSGTERGIAYGTVNGNNRLYVLSRSTTPPQIRALDPATGNDVTLPAPFDLSTATGGTFIANDIEISSDGVVFVGNVASSVFKLYVWTAEGGAPTAYTFTLPTVSGVRYGDKFSVVGSWSAGTIEIWVPGGGSTSPGTVQVLKTVDQGSTWTTTQITLSGAYTSTVSSTTVAPYGPGGNFYISGNGANPRQHDNTGAYVASSVFLGTNSSIAAVKCFTAAGRNFLVTVAYRDEGVSADPKNTRSFVYDVTTPSAVTKYGVTSLLSDNTATVSNAVNGDAAVMDNGDGTITIIVLGTDQGVAAFKSTAAPLPVELTSFTVTAITQGMMLQWSTATEINNYGFEIERSLNGTWEKIGLVRGAGTTNAPQQYSYVDVNPMGITAYRLKQIDIDGKFRYTSEAEASVAAIPSAASLGQNYPNPFNPTTTIRYSVPSTGYASLKIFNTLGAEVATLVDGIVTSGVSHTSIFDASSLPSGVYYYTLRSGGYVNSQKMILLK